MERQKLMSFAYQVVGEKKITAHNMSQYPGYKKNPYDDKAIAEELHRVMMSADILLGQNSDQFDVKMANYFFLMNGLPSLPPKKYIDTKKIAKRYFRFANNTLDNLGEEMGFGGKTKVKHSDIWQECFLLQDKSMWKKMDTYCKNDVDKTTKIYLKMRGFMHQHPSLSRITGEYDSCPRCGGFDYRVKAYRTTNTSRYHQYFCNDCEGYFSDRTAITEKQGDLKPNFVNV